MAVIGQRRESKEGNTGYVRKRKNVNGLKLQKEHS